MADEATTRWAPYDDTRPDRPSLSTRTDPTALSQLLSTNLLCNYISYYLALLQGEDPSTVPAIDLVNGTPLQRWTRSLDRPFWADAPAEQTMVSKCMR